MKVLALVTEAFGGSGGIAQYNRDFLCALADSGLVSAIEVVPRNAPNVTRPALRIRQVAARPGRVAYSAAAMRTAIGLRPDVVFCGHLYMVPLAAVLARLTRARLVVQTHGIEAWPRPGALRRAALESAHLVLCVSRYTRARVLDWATLDPERVLVLPNTFDEAFSPGDGSTFRTRWGLGSARVLLTVGRMDAAERYKGHERVIAAIPGLVARGHDIVYLVIGDGTDRPRLETLVGASGVAERIRFIGAVDHETLKSAYRAADLFVMPSTGEGFGIAFVEAMASGTPALGLAVAGACDALADGALGTAVDERDFVPALAAALERPKPDGTALAAAVRRRFGRERFAAAAHAAMVRMTRRRTRTTD